MSAISRSPHAKACLIVGLFLWGMFAVAVVRPACGLLGRRGATKRWDAIRQNWHRSICRVLGLSITITGETGLGAGLVVANHISWLDIVVLGSFSHLDFIAKEDVAHWPVLGYLAKNAGTLFIRRGDAVQTQAAAEQMAWRLRQGRQLMLFPEATTTTGERVLRFQTKLFKPAQLADSSVQAVAIRYDGAAATIAPFVGDDDFVSHLWRTLQLTRLEVHLHICPAQLSGWDIAEIAGSTRGQIIAALEAGTLLVGAVKRA